MKNRNKFSDPRYKAIALLMAVLIILTVIFVLYNNQQRDAVPIVSVKANNCYDETITVVADYDYEPYTFMDKDGNMSGHDVELIYCIANEMKVNVDLKFMKWNDAMKAMEENKADVILGIEYANEESNLYDLTIPFNSDQFICFGKKNYEYINELAGKKIATSDENKNYEYLFKFAENIDIDSYSTAFEDLAADRVDYVICRYSVGRRIVARMNNSEIKAVGPTLINNQLCMGVNKNDPELCRRINDATEELMNKDYMEKLSDKWLGEYVQIVSLGDYVKHFQNYFIIGGATIILIILCLLLLLLSRMRKAKESAEINEKCIEIISAQTGNAIFEWDNIEKRNVVEMNFDMFRDIFGNDAKTQRYSDIQERIRSGEIFSGERFKLVDKNGKDIWFELTTAVVTDKNGTVSRVIGAFENVNHQVHHEEKLKKKAEIDLLTGVYNKVTVGKIIGSILERNTDTGSVLFVVDIDNLKYVNDNFGHLYGDIIIKKIAVDLRRTFRSNDIVGRIGGDEFVAFLKNCDNEQVAMEKAEEICKNFKSIIEEKGQTFETTTSVGIAISKPGDTYMDLYRKADAALYSIKKNGKNGCAVYKD